MWGTIEYLGLALIPGFIVLDLVTRARNFETPNSWRLRALVVTVLTFALSMAVTIFWGTLLAGVSLVDGSKLGIVGGALVGILVYEFIHYWYHRAAHANDLLWRWAHQMHHSAESARRLWRLLPATRWIRSFSRRGRAWSSSRCWVSPRKPAFSAGSSWSSTRCSSTPTSRPPAGWATSSSGRRATVFTTNAVNIDPTIRIFPSGTWSSAPSKTPRPSTRRQASTPAPRAGSATC